jgi:RNA polymerase sigma-70 factor, ECF subfamily
LDRSIEAASTDRRELKRRGIMNARPKPQADDPGTHPSARDAAAWPDEHGDALYRYARSRVGSRELAEDLVQDAFLAALQSRDRFQGQSTVRTWLLSILRHKIVDHYRRAAGPPHPGDAGGGADPDRKPDAVLDRNFNEKGLWKKALASWKAPDQEMEDREFWDVLDGCLGRLPRSLSSAFILRELEALDPAQLRDVLALSEVNLRVRLHRARLLLRECLEKHWFADKPDGSRRTP